MKNLTALAMLTSVELGVGCYPPDPGFSGSLADALRSADEPVCSTQQVAEATALVSASGRSIKFGSVSRLPTVQVTLELWDRHSQDGKKAMVSSLAVYANCVQRVAAGEKAIDSWFVTVHAMGNPLLQLATTVTGSTEIFR